MLRLLVFLLVPVSLWGQSAAAPSSAGSTFYAVGLNGFPQTSPKPTGMFLAAVQVSAKAQVWSFNETDFTLVNKKVVTSVRSGMYTPLRSIGTAEVGFVGDAGVATNGMSSVGAYAGGLALRIPLGKGFMFFPGFRVLKSAITGNVVVWGIAVGRSAP